MNVQELLAVAQAKVDAASAEWSEAIDDMGCAREREEAARYEVEIAIGYRESLKARLAAQGDKHVPTL